jgi:hypothetical protein
MVIDHEKYPASVQPLYAVAIYVIEFGRISKVYFKQ